MINATQLRNGMIIIYDNDLYRVTAVKHLTPGKGHGFMQTKLRNLKTGVGTEHKFRSEDRVDRATLESREMQYLYAEDDRHTFMDTESYEQTELTSDEVGDILPYLLPTQVVNVELYEGSPVGVTLASAVELEVVETEPFHEGRHRLGFLQARHAGDRRHGPGAAVHSDRRPDSGGSV